MRKKRHSAAVALVLCTSISLIGCDKQQDPPLRVLQQNYASTQDCQKDWPSEKDCQSSTNGGAVGPRYYTSGGLAHVFAPNSSTATALPATHPMQSQLNSGSKSSFARLMSISHVAANHVSSHGFGATGSAHGTAGS